MDPNLSVGEDIRYGLAGGHLLEKKVSDPQFEGQTKTKLGNITEVKSFAQIRKRPQISHWFEANRPRPVHQSCFIRFRRARCSAQGLIWCGARAPPISRRPAGQLTDRRSTDPSK